MIAYLFVGIIWLCLWVCWQNREYDPDSTWSKHPHPIWINPSWTHALSIVVFWPFHIGFHLYFLCLK